MFANYLSINETFFPDIPGRMKTEANCSNGV